MWAPLSLLVVLVVNACAKIVVPTSDEVKEAFTVFRVVPEVLPVVPETPLIDIFGDCQTKLGNRIPPWCTTTPPYTTWINANPNTLYTTVAIDPDYPQYFASNNTQFLHSLTVNIPGLNMEQGDELSPYVPCAPLAGSGDHRYVCLVFKQQAPITVTTELLISIAQNIRTFSISEFVKRFKLGNPVAGSLFRSRQSLFEPERTNDTCECCGSSCGYANSDKNHCC